MKIIYDCGANNGDDIPYYLLKADKVVAIEANPTLAANIRSRFSEHISSGKLIVEQCVVTGDDCETSAFYVNENLDYLGTTNIPLHQDSKQYKKVLLPAKSINSLIDKHGPPYYVKIDLEGSDNEILTSILSGRYRPTYMSVEAHSFDVLTTLVCLGQYNSFKVVDGLSVPEKYSKVGLRMDDGTVCNHSFPLHSAGPFGNDISGHWMCFREFYKYFAFVGTGWKDIHVSSVDQSHDSPFFEQLSDINGVTGRWIFKVALKRVKTWIIARLTVRK
jgi:FkbM family methyltransferase